MKSQVELEQNLQGIVIKINKCTKEMAKAITSNNKERARRITHEISELDARRQTLQWVLQ